MAKRIRKKRQGENMPSSSPTLYEIDLTKIPLSEVETGMSLAIAGILIELSAEQGSSRITVNREEVDRRLRAKGYDPDTGERLP
jgi:hypothetical protein